MTEIAARSREQLQPLVKKLQDNIERVFLGRPEVIRHVLTGLLGGGHVLLEDVPGVGKTVLAKSLARSIDTDFRRVQFTPDLLPSDIVGVAIYAQQTGAFEFKPGPIFTNVLLADEINRATPRTQSALLEAMNDAQVTVDRVSHPLPRPFFVIATQNPYEFEGTYPLPESQLDRFMLRVRVGYPSAEDEKAIIRAQQTQHPLDSLEPVLSAADVAQLQRAAREVRIQEPVLEYLLALVRKTRGSKHLTLGGSPRASIALLPGRAGARPPAGTGLRLARRRQGARDARPRPPRHRARLRRGGRRRRARPDRAGPPRAGGRPGLIG